MMNDYLIQAYYAAFMLFGVFAILNAHLGKWPQCLVFTLMMAVSFLSGVLQGLSPVWGLLLLGFLGITGMIYALKLKAIKNQKTAIDGEAGNAAEISARMLDQMNRNVAERKSRSNG